MMELRWFFLAYTAIPLIGTIQQVYLASTLLDPNRRKQAALFAVAFGSLTCCLITFDIQPSSDVLLKAFMVELVVIGVWTLWIPPELAMERCRGLPSTRCS